MTAIVAPPAPEIAGLKADEMPYVTKKGVNQAGLSLDRYRRMLKNVRYSTGRMRQYSRTLDARFSGILKATLTVCRRADRDAARQKHQFDVHHRQSSMMLPPAALNHEINLYSPRTSDFREWHREIVKNESGISRRNADTLCRKNSILARSRIEMTIDGQRGAHAGCHAPGRIYQAA